MKNERKQLILGTYFTLEMCRKKLNKYAHIYLNNIQVAKRYNEVKNALSLIGEQETEQLKKISDQQKQIDFKTKVLKTNSQTLSEQPVTKKDLKIAQTELCAMQDTLKAIQEKKTMLRHTIMALLQNQTEEQVIEETTRAKESYFKILVNYNKLLHEINALAGTAHAQKPMIIQEVNPICLEQLLGEPCEHEQH